MVEKLDVHWLNNLNEWRVRVRLQSLRRECVTLHRSIKCVNYCFVIFSVLYCYVQRSELHLNQRGVGTSEYTSVNQDYWYYNWYTTVEPPLTGHSIWPVNSLCESCSTTTVLTTTGWSSLFYSQNSFLKKGGFCCLEITSFSRNSVKLFIF